MTFPHFGSPTCGWCHKLEEFLPREDMAPIFGSDFVDIKIDVTRMTGGEEILEKYNRARSIGIPWFMFLDPKGVPIVSSDGPTGHIGYPGAPHEIDHFIAMLKKARRKIEPAQVEAIEKALKAEAEKLNLGRPATPAATTPAAPVR